MRSIWTISGRRLFPCREKNRTGGCSGEFSGASAGSFRGGRKPSPKPSAFESEIHPPHKSEIYAPGYFALAGGKFAQAQIPIRPKGRGAWTALLLTASFQGKCGAAPEAARKRQPLTARIRAWVRSKPPCGGCSQRAWRRDSPPKERKGVS